MRKNSARPSRRLLSRTTVIKLVIAAAVISAGLYGVHVLMRHQCFRIREVIVREGQTVLKERSADFRFLIGKNIFSVDLKRYGQSVAALNPVYRKARFIRYLPDSICVDLLKRAPLAVIDPQRRLCIDEKLVVFEDDAPRSKPLPVINGFKRLGSCSRPGYRCAMPEIALAASVLAAGRHLAIERVLVADSLSATIVLSKGIQVKIGSEEVAAKMGFLTSLLSQMGRDAAKVEYIDLRFKEPVIKFKPST